MIVDMTGLRVPVRDLRVAVVSTYPPDRCGIGRFSASLVNTLRKQPGVTVEVVRLVGADAPPRAVTGDVVMEIDPESPVAVRRAAQRLSQSDVAVIQHEYGIYGADDGAAVVDLVNGIGSAVVVVLHTVVRHPSPRQRSIIESLAKAADALVVPSRSAQELLVSTYGVDPMMVSVIPHGATWPPLPMNTPPRRRLLTWGLLGPGKGVERAIRAVAGLEIPDVDYLVAGQTHPAVLRRSGPAYRRELEALVAELGVGDRVRFDDHYRDEAWLGEAIAASDVVVLPYDTTEQICSGVLSEAVAAGRPVVATAFPHAVELLSDGAGIVVDHDEKAMAEALGTLLTDELAYRRAAGAAATLGSTLGWDSVGARYASLFGGLVGTGGVVA